MLETYSVSSPEDTYRVQSTPELIDIQWNSLLYLKLQGNESSMLPVIVQHA